MIPKPCIEPGCPNMALPTSPRCRPHHRTRTGVYRDPRYRAAVAYGVCHICGEGGADTRDHVVPVDLGGSNDESNLRPAHRSCNSSKKAR